jgi:hypothetical protein
VPEEDHLYENVALDVEELHSEAGTVRVANSDNKMRLFLRGRWFRSLSCLSFGGAYSDRLTASGYRDCLFE